MILVNGWMTKEITIQMGLSQGGPVAHFLFLLVAEGFSCLFSRVVDLQFFLVLEWDPMSWWFPISNMRMTGYFG